MSFGESSNCQFVLIAENQTRLEKRRALTRRAPMGGYIYTLNIPSGPQGLFFRPKGLKENLRKPSHQKYMMLHV